MGMIPGEVVITGFVPDNDLVSLYRLCKLFVFPSWHEGFGLPALEAMSCGAPVIGSNISSLPEVIGWDDALFDPFSDNEMSVKIAEVLTNDGFRTELIRHGTEQAKRFSWDESAHRVLTAFERFQIVRQQGDKITQMPRCRPKLAYISPLPPEKSGIADYSAELLPELARHYEIEVIVRQEEVSDPWINACLPIRSHEWFLQHSDCYDRVIYHIGNSTYHQHMFAILDRISGVVVLHDFFLGNINSHIELHGDTPGRWIHQLYKSHGYFAVYERFHTELTVDVAFKYPCNFDVIQSALGVIVHSNHAIQLAKKWYLDDAANGWATVPLLRVPARMVDKKAARQKLGLKSDDFIVCSFGVLGSIKQNTTILTSWLKSRLSQDQRCHLIFVGENDAGSYGRKMLDRIRQSGLGDRIRITGWVEAENYRAYLSAADLAVQLRNKSRGETSAAVLDCMNYGLATIVNANGSMTELPQDAVWMLKDEFGDDELIDALETLWSDAKKRHDLGSMAHDVISSRHSPRICADKYAEAIETFYTSMRAGRNGLIDFLAQSNEIPNDDASVMSVAAAISQNLPLKSAARQILVDISAIAQIDLRTGIQRVTRSILNKLLSDPPIGYRIEPVYATGDRLGYRYAMEFTLRFLDCPSAFNNDEPIEVQPGDVFLGLDLHPSVVPFQMPYLKELRDRGVNIYFVVYDLLPVLLPHAFPEGIDHYHAKWLKSIVEFDGALCISRTVADELREWLKTNGPERMRSFKVGFFHLGADVEDSVPSRGLPDTAHQLLAQLSLRSNFLLVGTIEPRKGHSQLIAAFDELWGAGVDANLVIVGKAGWDDFPQEMRRNIPQIIEKLRDHPELGKRLFWLEGISDEYLEKVYASCTCLIAPSEGEGFGLPLIEAAQHKLPIIARDIPVFREVAGDHAYYFSGMEPADLAEAIKKWLALYEMGQHPKSDDMPWLTWKQSAQQLLDIILKGTWYAEWMNQTADK